jgi:hypothetical protein
MAQHITWQGVVIRAINVHHRTAMWTGDNRASPRNPAGDVILVHHGLALAKQGRPGKLDGCQLTMIGMVKACGRVPRFPGKSRGRGEKKDSNQLAHGYSPFTMIGGMFEIA